MSNSCNFTCRIHVYHSTHNFTGEADVAQKHRNWAMGTDEQHQQWNQKDSDRYPSPASVKFQNKVF